MRLLVTAFVVAAILTGAAACGGGGGGNGDAADGGDPGAAPGEIAGVITKIARSGGTITGFTLRTDGGESHEITLDPAVDYGFQPELLVQHMRAKDRIRATVDRRDGRLYATVILYA